MDRTDPPADPPAWRRILTLVAELAGLFALLLGVIALVESRGGLVAPMLIAAAVALFATGGAGLARCSGPVAPAELRMEASFACLCIFVGLALLVALAFSNLVAALVGVSGALLLVRYGSLRTEEVSDAGRRREGKMRAGTLVLAIIIIVFLVTAALAVAQLASNSSSAPPETPHPEEPEKHEPEEGMKTSPGPTPKRMGTKTYAELCVNLRDPNLIGHGLGRVFEEEDAVKAGCGTEPFRVGETGTWVAAGICVGQRISVAVSSPDHVPVLTYGQPSRFIWAEAKAGELTGVEIARPEGGEVVLVETRHGTYGFARSKRSAVPGNEEAQSCNEVGGVAEPFARMPPPLLVLWTQLVSEDATWYWPTYDREDGLESVAFIATVGVVQGQCEGDRYCTLEIDGSEREREGGEFVTMAALSEYMPPEE